MLIPPLLWIHFVRNTYVKRFWSRHFSRKKKKTNIRGCPWICVSRNSKIMSFTSTFRELKSFNITTSLKCYNKNKSIVQNFKGNFLFKQCLCSRFKNNSFPLSFKKVIEYFFFCEEMDFEYGKNSFILNICANFYESRHFVVFYGRC